MGLIMQEGKFVSRDEVARIDTPCSTDTWRPVPHIDVIKAVTKVVRAHDWEIEGEKFGLAREGQKMFGVMEIARSSSPEWHRCIDIRNSHDKSFAVGLSAGIVVCVCTNMAFGGTTVIKRRHTSGIDLAELIDRAVASLEDDFLTTETVCEDLKDEYLKEGFDDYISKPLRGEVLENMVRKFLEKDANSGLLKKYADERPGTVEVNRIFSGTDRLNR